MILTNLQCEEDGLCLQFSVQQEASLCAIRGCEPEAIDLRSSSRVSVCNTQILNILLGEITASEQRLPLQEQLTVLRRLQHAEAQGSVWAVRVRQEQGIGGQSHGGALRNPQTGVTH